jgi:hypothetical protein
MTAKQNITVSLRRELLVRARALAAQRRVSVSGLLEQEIEKQVTYARAYAASRRKALALLKQGMHLGGQAIANRDALHDRAGLR